MWYLQAFAVYTTNSDDWQIYTLFYEFIHVINFKRFTGNNMKVPLSGKLYTRCFRIHLKKSNKIDDSPHNFITKSNFVSEKQAVEKKSIVFTFMHLFFDMIHSNLAVVLHLMYRVNTFLC